MLSGARGEKHDLTVFTCVFSHEIEYYQSWKKMQIKLKPGKIVFGITAAWSPQVFAEIEAFRK